MLERAMTGKNKQDKYKDSRVQVVEPTINFSDLNNNLDNEQLNSEAAITPVRNIVLGLLLLLAVLFFTWNVIFRNYKLEYLFNTLAHADYFWISIGFLLMVVHQLCIAFSIILILRAIAPAFKLGFFEGFNTSFIGFFFNNITPSSSGGQPMQMFYLKKLGIPVSYTSVVFIILAIFYNGAMLFYCFVVNVLRLDYLRQHLGFVYYLLPLGYVLYISTTAFLLLVTFKPKLVVNILRNVLGFLLKKRFIRKPKKLVRKLSVFSKRYMASSDVLAKKRKLVWQLVLLHLLQLGAYTAVPFFVCKAILPAHLPTWDLFKDSFTMQAVLNIAASLVPSPGAVGLTEGCFVELFRSIAGHKQVVTVMLLTRIVNLYVFLLIAAAITIICYFKVGLRFNKQGLKKFKAE